MAKRTKDSYSPIGSDQAAKEMSNARRMASAAMAFALMSVLLIVAIGMHLARQRATTMRQSGVVGLSAFQSALGADATAGLRGLPSADEFALGKQGLGHFQLPQGLSAMEGWCRTFLDIPVREGMPLASQQTDVVKAGTLVYVKEVEAMQVRIVKPVEGWMSVANQDGIAALFPEMMLRGQGEDADITEAASSSSFTNEAMQTKLAEMAAMQKKLGEAMAKLKARSEALKKAPSHIGEAVKDHAPAMADSLKHGAAKAAKDIAGSERAEAEVEHVAENGAEEAKALLKQLGKEPGLKGFFH